KIASIYEGTSGIQAMDLLARKIGANKGAAFGKLMSEMNLIISKAKETEVLVPLAEKLESAVNGMGKVTMEIGQKASSLEFKTAFAHSLPYLHVVGDVIMGWMLLWRAVVASEKLNGKCKKKDIAFYNGQIKTAEFFIRTELIMTMGKIAAIEEGCSAAVDISDDEFGSL
ncbi:acyl-CoA dehydrogenase, partial [bacterium]|nr:acyl-CoA dehydrogenase [bacterium]